MEEVAEIVNKVPKNTPKWQQKLNLLLIELELKENSAYLNNQLKDLRNRFVQFSVNTLVTGLVIHLSLLWVYFHFQIRIEWFLHFPLLVSYGLFYHTFLDPIYKKWKGG